MIKHKIQTINGINICKRIAEIVLIGIRAGKNLLGMLIINMWKPKTKKDALAICEFSWITPLFIKNAQTNGILAIPNAIERWLIIVKLCSIELSQVSMKTKKIKE